VAGYFLPLRRDGTKEHKVKTDVLVSVEEVLVNSLCLGAFVAGFLPLRHTVFK
jgi:hypothetical protein